MAIPLSGTLYSIDPDTVVAGSASFTIHCHGDSFPGTNTTIELDGAAIDSTFISTNQYDGTVPASAIATPGTISVRVHKVGASPSNALNLLVTSPAPVVTGVTPTTTLVGVQKTISVAGSKFEGPGAKVWWDGSAGKQIDAVVSSQSQLSFVLPAAYADLNANHTFRVMNPGGILSNSWPLPVVNPVPSILSLSPVSKPVNSTQFSLTITGDAFTSTADALWDGASLNVTSRTGNGTIIATVPASFLTVAGTHQIKVRNPSPGGGYSNTLTFYVGDTTGIPVIGDALGRHLSPFQANVGGEGFTLTVYGTGFKESSVVRWAGADRQTSYAGSGQLGAQILAGDLLAAVPSPGVPVTVYNPPPGGGSSNSYGFIIVSSNPVPAITVLTPASVAAGTPSDFTLLVTGTNFAADASVQWNGISLVADGSVTPTSTLTSGVVPASYAATATTAAITVYNPPPGGGSSQSALFQVAASGENPVPVLDSTSPDRNVAAVAWLLASTYALNDIVVYAVNGRYYRSKAAGNIGHTPPTSPPYADTYWDATLSMTVAGSDFVSGAAVCWAGTPMTTSYISAASLLCSIPTANFAGVGSFDITVRNPEPVPGNGNSNAVPFAVTSPTANPEPVLYSISPETIDRGANPEPLLTVLGRSFVVLSKIMWNGVQRQTTYSNPGKLTMQVASSDIAELAGVVIRMNPAAHAVAESTSARRVQAFDAGDLQRPALSMGEGMGLFRTAGMLDSIDVAAGGVNVGRFQGGFATQESLRMPPWIEPEVTTSGTTTVNTTGATDIVGTARTIIPARDVRVQVVATFDVSMTSAGVFIGELAVNGAARPGRAIWAPSATSERATVFQCWNFTIAAGAQAALKLTGSVTAGAFTVNAHTRYSLFGVGRY